MLLTQGQKKALFESLDNQKSEMTKAEQKFYNDHKNIFTVKLTGAAQNYERLNDKVRQINFDNFGENYRNCWIKIYNNSKGEYFYSSYTGKRIYL
jgi:hypothetical protein